MARLTPAARKNLILKAAVDFARREGWTYLTRDAVAAEAECAEGLVNHYFGDFTNLRDDVMRYAVRSGLLALIAEGLEEENDVAEHAPEVIKERARVWKCYQ